MRTEDRGRGTGVLRLRDGVTERGGDGDGGKRHHRGANSSLYWVGNLSAAPL